MYVHFFFFLEKKVRTLIDSNNFLHKIFDHWKKKKKNLKKRKEKRDKGSRREINRGLV